MSLIVLVECTEETCLKIAVVNESDKTTTPFVELGKDSHLKEANLIETTAEKVDSMAVVGSSNG